MAAKRYSAGAIFLQVVPVFADVQREIEREAKKIDNSLGDSMEASGKKAGKRAGKAAAEQMNAEIEKGSAKSSETFQKNFQKNISEIEKSLGNLNINRFDNDTRKKLAAKTFRHTSAYDALIGDYLTTKLGETLPEV